MKSQKSHKIVEIKVFLTFLLLDVRIWIPTKMTDPDGPKTYGFSGCGSTTLLTIYDPCDDYLN
jgi:hypothetical protein